MKRMWEEKQIEKIAEEHGGGGVEVKMNTPEHSDTPLRNLKVGDNVCENQHCRDIVIDGRTITATINGADGVDTPKYFIQGLEVYYFEATLNDSTHFTGTISHKEWERIINNDDIIFVLKVVDSSENEYKIRLGSLVYNPINNDWDMGFFAKLGNMNTMRWEFKVNGTDSSGHAITGTAYSI